MRVDSSVGCKTTCLCTTVLRPAIPGHNAGEFDDCKEGWIKGKTRK